MSSTSRSLRPTRRTTLAAGLALATSLALSACGGGSVTGNSSDVASEGGKQEVLIWSQATGDAGTKLNEMVKAYNASQSDYTVTNQYIPAEAFTSRLVSAVSSGQAPDLVLGDENPSALGQVIAADGVAPLTDLFGTGPNPLAKEDIPEGLLSSGTFDGTVYSLPTEGGDYALFYNKKAFADAGVSEQLETWDDVAAAAKTLTTDGTYGIYLPIGSGEWPVFTYQSMLWSAGGEFLNEDNTKVEFGSDAGVKALQTWTDMVKDGVAYPSSMADSNQNQGWPGFNAGQYDMFIGGAYNIGSVSEGIGAENVGVVPFPSLGEPAMNTGTNNSYVIKGDESSEAAAWQFLSWFMQPDQQAEWDITTGYLPTNQKTLDSDTWKQHVEENPLLQPFVDQLSYARSRPSIPQYAEVSAALSTQIEAAMLQKTSAADAIATAATDAQAALDAK